MKDSDKRKEQLTTELAELRHRISELEASEAERNRGEEREAAQLRLVHHSAKPEKWRHI